MVLVVEGVFVAFERAAAYANDDTEEGESVVAVGKGGEAETGPERETLLVFITDVIIRSTSSASR